MQQIASRTARLLCIMCNIKQSTCAYSCSFIPTFTFDLCIAYQLKQICFYTLINRANWTISYLVKLYTLYIISHFVWTVETSSNQGRFSIGPISPNCARCWSCILSAVQVHTTTHCMFYREQQLGPAYPKADPGSNRTNVVPNCVISQSN